MLLKSTVVYIVTELCIFTISSFYSNSTPRAKQALHPEMDTRSLQWTQDIQKEAVECNEDSATMELIFE